MSSNEDKHYLSGKRIIVSGAGISGITFCLALKEFLGESSERIDPLPSIVVYERETSADAIGREGYSLSIRSDPFSGGMQILQKLSVLNQMLEYSNPGTHFSMFDNQFIPLIEMRAPPVEGLPQSFLRIARSKLRQILIKNVHPSIVIHWNRAVKSAKELESGKVSISLSDGGEEECDLFIVADGSKSIVRQILRPSDQLHFAGVCSITRPDTSSGQISFTVRSNMGWSHWW